MNDFLIKMLATQLKITPEVLEQLKHANPRIVDASVSEENAEIVTITIEVSEPGGTFPVIVTMPTTQLHRIPSIYERVMRVAYRTTN